MQAGSGHNDGVIDDPRTADNNSGQLDSSRIQSGTLLRTLQPHLNEGIYAFASVPAAFDVAAFDVGALGAIATFREAEA